ncbi:MAG: hypothetical protein ABI852_21640, partial [Gemmatimonadaceae bacterium]
MNDSEIAAAITARLNHDKAIQSLADGQRVLGGKDMRAIGMGNFAGWGVSAGIVGAVLGGIAGRGVGGAIAGALVLGGGLWLLAQVATRTHAYHRDAKPLRWLVGGAATGAAVGT